MESSTSFSHNTRRYDKVERLNTQVARQTVYKKINQSSEVYTIKIHDFIAEYQKPPISTISNNWSTNIMPDKKQHSAHDKQLYRYDVSF